MKEKQLISNKFNQLKKENQRTILALALAQAVLGSQMPMYIILGGLIGQSLASSACYATLPISLIIIGSMASSPILSNLMQSTSRRFGFFSIEVEIFGLKKNTEIINWKVYGNSTLSQVS